MYPWINKPFNPAEHSVCMTALEDSNSSYLTVLLWGPRHRTQPALLEGTTCQAPLYVLAHKL